MLKLSSNVNECKPLSYGTAKEPGKDGEGFCMPTDVAVAEDGSFFVSDGYCNARVARFDAAGGYAGQWAGAYTRPLVSPT